MLVFCATTTIVSWLFVFRQCMWMLPAGDAGNMICEMSAGTHERPLSLPERRLTSVPANSGSPYVPFLAKVMPKNFVNFGMTLLKNGHMGYCD